MDVDRRSGVTHRSRTTSCADLPHRALFALLVLLALDAQRGLRPRLEPLLADRLLADLAEPERALREARRVLVAGGTVALAASDWSRARFEPWTPDVARAMSAHYRLRTMAGGDPHAGGGLAARVERAGFVDVTETSHHRVDLTYRELARYAGSRLEAALRADNSNTELRLAAEAARRWATTDGSVEQCWTEVTGRSG